MPFECVELTIPGRPVPAARMRIRSTVLDPRKRKYLAYKDQVHSAARAAGIQPFPSDVDLAVSIRVYIANLPGNWDNYAQAVCDGLEGAAFTEQRQVKRGAVVLLQAGKGCERAEVTITPLKAGRMIGDAADR